jgi:TonB family protein
MKTLVGFFLFLIASSVFSQKVSYLNENYEPTNKKNATFYRIISSTEHSGLFLIQQYFMDGSIEFEGYSTKKEEPFFLQGEAIKYDYIGRKTFYTFKDNLYHGWLVSMDNDDTLSAAYFQNDKMQGPYINFFHDNRWSYKIIDGYIDGEYLVVNKQKDTLIYGVFEQGVCLNYRDFGQKINNSKYTSSMVLLNDLEHWKIFKDEILVIEAFYKNGKPVGLWQTYTYDGKHLFETLDFTDVVCIDTDHYQKIDSLRPRYIHNLSSRFSIMTFMYFNCSKYPKVLKHYYKNNKINADEGPFSSYVVKKGNFNKADTIFYSNTWKIVNNSEGYSYYSIFALNEATSLANYSEYYESGKLKFEGSFVKKDDNFIPNGTFIWYYNNGQKEQSGEYNNGLPVGDWVGWDKNGNVTKSKYTYWYEDKLGTDYVFSIGLSKPPIIESCKLEEDSYSCTNKSIQQFIAKNLEYPTAAQALGISGRVYIYFEVNSEGEVTEISIDRGLEFLDKMALNVIKSMDFKWLPAEINQHKVAAGFIIPISFQLSE